MLFPSSLEKKILKRKADFNLRELSESSDYLIDFTSNDYLGLSKSVEIFNRVYQILKDYNSIQNGATGSRLLSGNSILYRKTESLIAQFHKSQSALIFNSGYDANIGFFSSVPQKDDVVLYDEYIHASIRDGIRLSYAKSYKFKHNDLENLEKKIGQCILKNRCIYIVTESVFSMDGDSPNITDLIFLVKKYHCYLILDEAHAVGVFGNRGEGILSSLGLEKDVFARIVTFGKAFGSHGAAILGTTMLRNYLINFARSFIYTTALPPHSLATIYVSYQLLATNEYEPLKSLKTNIRVFKQELKRQNLKPLFVQSKSAIQSAIIPGNERVKNIADHIQKQGFDVKAILSPTVPEGQERLRFCLHSYNTENEIIAVLKELILSI